MKIEFLSPKRIYNITKEPEINLLSIKKLSFNKGARLKYDISGDTYFRIGLNTDDPNDNSIYLMRSTKDDKKARKVQKAGYQLVLPVYAALNKLNLDFENKRYKTEVEDLKINNMDFIRVKFIIEHKNQS
jgi:hypothetical protein